DVAAAHEAHARLGRGGACPVLAGAVGLVRDGAGGRLALRAVGLVAGAVAEAGVALAVEHVLRADGVRVLAHRGGGARADRAGEVALLAAAARGLGRVAAHAVDAVAGLALVATGGAAGAGRAVGGLARADVGVAPAAARAAHERAVHVVHAVD